MAHQYFESVLARYQQNLTEYKVTGKDELKPIIDRDKNWLDMYINWLGKISERQQSYIQAFVKDYQQTNPELVKMQGQLKDIREKGPVLQDVYETEKKAQEEEPIDYTPYYVKAGLIVGIAVAVGVVSALRPTYMR